MKRKLLAPFELSLTCLDEDMIDGIMAQLPPLTRVRAAAACTGLHTYVDPHLAMFRRLWTLLHDPEVQTRRCVTLEVSQRERTQEGRWPPAQHISVKGVRGQWRVSSYIAGDETHLKTPGLERVMRECVRLLVRMWSVSDEPLMLLRNAYYGWTSHVFGGPRMLPVIRPWESDCAASGDAAVARLRLILAHMELYEHVRIQFAGTKDYIEVSRGQQPIPLHPRRAFMVRRFQQPYVQNIATSWESIEAVMCHLADRLQKIVTILYLRHVGDHVAYFCWPHFNNVLPRWAM